MRKFRIGILGCGVISNTYISDIQHFYKDLMIEACADIVPEAAAACAEKYGIARSCTPDELLADDRIDIIVNLTPPDLHPAMNRRIIEAGKHLFCEKPFAPSLETAAQILDLADRKGVRVGCAPDTFLSSGLQSMRFYLDTGIIYQDTEDARQRREQFYELPEVYTRTKDYSRGLGVLELADSIDAGTVNRTGRDLILHITEAIEGVRASAQNGGFYTMKTTCERPAPIPPGVPADRLH